MIKAILAHDAYWGIGKDGKLPWPKNDDDLRWFKQCTEHYTVVMGRKTWDSLPRQPLPNRHNVIVSSSLDPDDLPDNTDIVHPNEIIEWLKLRSQPVWIIGGAHLVETCLPVIDELWLNDVGGDYDCDTFLPIHAITQQFKPDTVELKNYGVITKWRKNHAQL